MKGLSTNTASIQPEPTKQTKGLGKHHSPRDHPINNTLCELVTVASA